MVRCFNYLSSWILFFIHLDKRRSHFSLPMGKRTEILPVFGKTFSLLMKAHQSVSVTLYKKQQANSARYRFLIFDNDKCFIYRTREGGSETAKHSISTPNALGSNPEWRSFWIDFRSSNLVLGSGGEVLLQWNDPSPISISYVSVTAQAATQTEIIVLNRPYDGEFILYIDSLLCLLFPGHFVNLFLSVNNII